MRVIVTGVTGNLGQEVLRLLLETDGVDVIPLVREESLGRVAPYRNKVEAVLVDNLLDEKRAVSLPDADCIIHCAGVVNFRRAGDRNQTMMAKVIEYARTINSSVCFVSTAFVYSPADGGKERFHNAYEEDKFKAEELLAASGVTYSIVRPSVITGSSKDGSIQNFSGYYSIVAAFLSAIQGLQQEGKNLRFPQFDGYSNIVPVDTVAAAVVDTAMRQDTGVFYLTNPDPPHASALMDKTLRFFGVRESVDLLDVSYDEYRNRNDLTEYELKLNSFLKHFEPYWSLRYDFPRSSIGPVPINDEYLRKVLGYFARHEIYKSR